MDYVAYRDAYREQHHWHRPDQRRLRFVWWDRRPKVLDVALALHGAGFTSPSSLRIIAQIWNEVEMNHAVDWPAIRKLNIRTLETLEREGLLRQRPNSDYNMAVNDWLFPLFPVNLEADNVKPEDLVEQQKHWYPQDSI